MTQEPSVSYSEVARVLLLLTEMPNQRRIPLEGDVPGNFDFWFDGGACRFETGATYYVLADGTRCSRPTLPGLHLGIDFADGRRVSVSQAKPVINVAKPSLQIGVTQPFRAIGDV